MVGVVVVKGVVISISKMSKLVMMVVGKQKVVDLDALSMHCGSHQSVVKAIMISWFWTQKESVACSFEERSLLLLLFLRHRRYSE